MSVVMKQEGVVVCDFCQTTEDGADMIIESASKIHICDKCVESCARLINDWKAEKEREQNANVAVDVAAPGC